MAPSSFSDSLRLVAAGLREEGHSVGRINHFAFAVDQLGRRLHGLGCLRDREVAECLTAAVRHLSRAPGLAEPERAREVREAIGQLDAALVHVAAGIRPAGGG